MTSTVSNIHAHGTWLWPEEWMDLYPRLIHANSIVLTDDKADSVCWKDVDQMVDFSTSAAWNTIRDRRHVVEWANVVWFPQCVPRHAFLMWLICRDRLLTRDKILAWGIDRRKKYEHDVLPPLLSLQ
jgi:hypothetical protein